MNFESNSFEELTSLASRMLDGDLPVEELTRLSELVSESDEAREAFAQFCELHSMLAAEPATQETLCQDQQPGNVVSLPGTKQIAVGPEKQSSSPEMHADRVSREIHFQHITSISVDNVEMCFIKNNK